MDLSIVTTLFHSAPYIKEFYDRVRIEAEKITSHYEIIFVNDGSPDSSLELAVSFYERDERVNVIDLSRNFGHHKAMMTGLAHAKGARVFLIDCDLEEEPELLGRFYAALNDSQADVVYGVRQIRRGSALEKATATLFYRLFNLLSTYPLPPHLMTARLMTQRYVAALLEHKEREVPIAGLWVITGFSQWVSAMAKAGAAENGLYVGYGPSPDVYPKRHFQNSRASADEARLDRGGRPGVFTKESDPPVGDYFGRIPFGQYARSARAWGMDEAPGVLHSGNHGSRRHQPGAPIGPVFRDGPDARSASPGRLVRRTAS